VDDAPIGQPLTDSGAFSRTTENAQFIPSYFDSFYRDDVAARTAPLHEGAQAELVAELGTRWACSAHFR
jgi:hypothetical protein